MVAIGNAHRHSPDRHATLKRELAALYRNSLVEHGVEPSPAALDLLALDIELNAQGMGIWLDKSSKEQRA
jgi:hypothetical protein